MKATENDVMELGSVSAETRGLASSGSPDIQQGAKYLFGGIETED